MCVYLSTFLCGVFLSNKGCWRLWRSPGAWVRRLAEHPSTLGSVSKERLEPVAAWARDSGARECFQNGLSKGPIKGPLKGHI